MEISFLNKSIDAYREISCQTKRIQESVESVVPDTDEDIGQIAAVQSSVLLKSKDITSRGVLVSGEARASLLYITESRDSVSFVRLSKSFSIEYDVSDITPDALAQISLSVVSAEGRIINPRKVSVSFDIAGEMSCYIREAVNIEASLPGDECPGLHVKYDSAELGTVNAVSEKTFSVNEQFSFPGGKPVPSRFVSGKAEFNAADCQLIGSKVIVKGSADISVCYLSDEVNYPVKTEFSTPFSQIVDIGEENMDLCSAKIELSGAYYDIIDSINGDKALNAELHAVLQMISTSRKKVVYASDAYSNLMPAECLRQNCRFNVLSDMQRIKLTADERISVSDDCADVLSAFVSPARIAQEQTKIRANVNLDIVYRTTSGQISAAGRSVALEGEGASPDIRIIGSRLSDVYLRPDGQYVDGHFALELTCRGCSSVEFERIVSVELDEEEPFDYDQYPTVTLVRTDGESLWELAKRYHSSVERIAALNDVDGDFTGKMLLIPKTV